MDKNENRAPLLLINSAPFTTEFVQGIQDFMQAQNQPCQLVPYHAIPENKEDYAGVIISASPRGDDIIAEQLPLYAWLKDNNKPVLGSCHGLQLMGVLWGAELKINNEAEEGRHTIFFKKDDALFKGLPTPYTVEQHHIKSIGLPAGFDLLASSEKCAVQVIKHKSKPLYGAQFHVENAPDLLLNFLNVVQNQLSI